jgi:hypothetical protein
MATSRDRIETMLDERFRRHEQQSAAAIGEVKDELRSMREEQAKHGERVLGVLAMHATKLELHEHRLGVVEKSSAEAEKAKLEGVRDWKVWALGLLGALAVSGLSALAALALAR